MDDVKRYKASGYRWARIAEDGDLVRYDDYIALRARLEAVEKDRDEWRQRAIDRCDEAEKWFRKYGSEQARAERAEAALKEADT